MTDSGMTNRRQTKYEQKLNSFKLRDDTISAMKDLLRDTKQCMGHGW